MTDADKTRNNIKIPHHQVNNHTTQVGTTVMAHDPTPTGSLETHRRLPVLLSTDAAMNAAKQSCFAWTIYFTTDLWKGSSMVPGSYDDAHSTKSKAYGILTML